jgi:6-pyruvoyl-tetrahydropterin synthase
MPLEALELSKPRILMRGSLASSMSFSITVTRTFQAAHRLRFRDGTEELSHSHDWLVRLTVARVDGALDELECVTDFHEVEVRLDTVLSPWNDSDLNTHEPFDKAVNPSAERVAEQIGSCVQLADDLRVVQVEVTEAPGCVATWRP